MSMGALRRRRFIQAAAEDETPPPDGVTVIAAFIHNDTGALGSQLVANRLILPESGDGSMTHADIAARLGSVWIGGVEQAINTDDVNTAGDYEGGYGTFPNGNARSMPVQFYYTFVDASPVACEVRIGITRGTTDIARQPFDKATIDARCVILPYEAAYKTRCKLTNRPLTPITNWNALELSSLATEFDSIVASLDPDGVQGSADYDAPRNLYDRWACQDGGEEFYFHAQRQAVSRIPLYFPCEATTAANGGSIAGTTFTDTTHGHGVFGIGTRLTGPGVAANTYIVDPPLTGTGQNDGGTYTVNISQTVTNATIAGTSYTPSIAPLMDVEDLHFGLDPVDGLTNETKSVYEWSFVALFVTTGWSYPWSVIVNRAQSFSRTATIPSTGIFTASADANHRQNWRTAGWWIASAAIDGTRRYANADYSARQESYVDEAPNILAALDFNKFDSSRGAYRTGMVGLNKGENAQTSGMTINGVVIAPGTNGVHPTFQVSITTKRIRDYRYALQDDAAILPMVKINVDAVLNCARPLPGSHYYENNGTGTGKYAVTYLMFDSIVSPLDVDGGPSGSGGKNDPFDIVMFASDVAQLAAAYPDEVVNGKTYLEWFAIFADPKQNGGLGFNHKYLGENKAFFDAPALRVHGDPGGPATIREPILHTLPPG
jgi:hypothetical protein